MIPLFKSCQTLLRPHGLYPIRLLCPLNFPGNNTGVGCHFLFQGIFLIQGSNPSLLLYRQIFYHWPQGSPLIHCLYLKSEIFFRFSGRPVPFGQKRKIFFGEIQHFHLQVSLVLFKKNRYLAETQSGMSHIIKIQLTRNPARTSSLLRAHSHNGAPHTAPPCLPSHSFIVDIRVGSVASKQKRKGPKTKKPKDWITE